MITRKRGKKKKNYVCSGLLYFYLIIDIVIKLDYDMIYYDILKVMYLVDNDIFM